jgi:hypothetical protein
MLIFRFSEGNKYASEIMISENQRKVSIRIKIEEIEIGYEEIIPFTIPPYERKAI